MLDPDERDFGDPTRRTYMAEERTLLAWWRSGLTTLAVSLAVGRLLPALLDQPLNTGFTALAIGFALLGVVFFLVGAYRHAAVQRALAEGRYRELQPWALWAITIALLLLATGTLILLFVES